MLRKSAKSQNPEKTTIDRPAAFCYSLPNSEGIGVVSEVRVGGQIASAIATHVEGTSHSECVMCPESQQQTILAPYRVHWMWNETRRRLVDLLGRAREGKHVLEASEFARWVRSSGLLKIFEAFPNDGLAHKVSGPEIEQLISDILEACDLFWRNQTSGPWVAKSELEAINQKLDLLAWRLAQISPPANQVETTVNAVRSILLEFTEAGKSAKDRPALHVIEGGGVA